MKLSLTQQETNLSVYYRNKKKVEAGEDEEKGNRQRD